VQSFFRNFFPFLLAARALLPGRCVVEKTKFAGDGGGHRVGPAATPLTSTCPRAALRMLELGVVSNNRLRASSWNPTKKKQRPPAIGPTKES